MLQRKALYFVRADLLDDPYEGYLTKPMADPAGYVESFKAAYLLKGKEFGEKEEALAKDIASKQSKLVREARRGWYVSCWHANEHESQAMWKLYTSMNDSICLRSTYKQFWDCLPEKDCYLGKVTYLDYDLDAFKAGNLLNPIMHKRSSFNHEREVRAVITDFDNFLNPAKAAAPGKVLEMDIQTLIKEVYVAPDSRAPLMEVVQRLVEQNGLNIQVKQSGVNAPPAY